MRIRRHQDLLVLGMFSRRSRLSGRIELLLKRGREFSPQASLARVVVTALVLLALVVASSFAPRWIAFAQQPPNPPLPPRPVAAPASPLPPAPPKPPALPPQVSTDADDSLRTALNFYGYETLTVFEMARLRTSGITADYISRMNRSGLGRSSRLPLDELVKLRGAGVTPDDAEAAGRVGFPADLFLAFNEIGFPHLEPRQITQAAMQGLHPENVRRASAYGPNLTLEEIVRLRDDHKLDHQNELEKPDANWTL